MTSSYTCFQRRHPGATLSLKPSVAAQWNRGLTRFLWKIYFFKSRSKLYPGEDGECVAIIYIRRHAPSWVTIPCDEPFTHRWICESKLMSTYPVIANKYTTAVCCEQCIIISNSCYSLRTEHHACHLLTISTKFVIENYMSLLIDALSMHNVRRRYLYHGKNSNSLAKTDINHVFLNTQRNQDNIERRVDDVELVLTARTTYTTICGPNMIKCHDGTCVSLSTICVSDSACYLDLCLCRMNGILMQDHNYCREKCHFKNCSCPSLMFQCSLEGCIPYFLVCDGQPHCADTSDEFCGNKPIQVNTPPHYELSTQTSYLVVIGSPQCLGFMCVDSLCISHHFVDDLIPDCNGAEDEQHGLDIKYKSSIYQCQDNQEIHCVPDHSKCFNIHKICLYDHDLFGHVAYCRDASHLFNCEWIECTNSFKCPSSYCIPLRKMCDGAKDCIDGEDETDCENNICPGYLKCSGAEICVHPLEVCDDFPHCPNSDDESMCDVKECPTECQCAGYSAICRDNGMLYIPIFATTKMKYLSLEYRDMFAPDFSNLTAVLELLVLDMARSGIKDICLSFQTYFPFYGSLMVLFLQYNQITQVASWCFRHIDSLVVIQLQGNHLKQISDSSFRGLSLEFLGIGDIVLSGISDEAFSRLRGLQWLDMVGVHLDYVSTRLSRALSNADTIKTGDARLCCVVYDVNCYHDTVPIQCSRILIRAYVPPIVTLLGVCIIALNVVSIWVNYKLIYNINRVQYILNYTFLIGGLLCGLYIMIIAAVDSQYGELYTINNIYWEGSFLCRSLYVIISTGLCLLTISTAVRQHIMYMAVTDTCFHVKRITSLAVKLSLVISLVMTTNSVIFTCLQNDLHQLCSVLTKTKPITVVAVLFALPLPLIMLVVLFHSIYTNVYMYKYVYTATAEMVMIWSSDLYQHNDRVRVMLKATVQSVISRSLECLPIPFIIFLQFCGAYIPPQVY